MINKQEAIDAIEVYRRNMAHILGDNDEKVKTIETCIMLVREAEETERWIPVSEGLPEEADGTVLVCMPDEFPFNQAEPYIGAKHNQQVTTATYSQFSKTWSCGRSPIAWMPLPEPYKEVRDEYSN